MESVIGLLNSVTAAKVVSWVFIWWFASNYERGRWRRGAKSDAPFVISGRMYFAQDITEEVLVPEAK